MYIVKLPSGRYINLEGTETIEFEFTNKEPSTAIVAVHWKDGGKDLYRGEDGQTILEHLDRLAKVNLPDSAFGEIADGKLESNLEGF